MNRMRMQMLLLTAMAIAGLAAGCAHKSPGREAESPVNLESSETTGETDSPASKEAVASVVTPGTEITELETGLSAVRYDGAYWFDVFLDQGGAASDSGVIEFLNGQMQLGAASPVFQTTGFGCSTLAVRSPEGEALFGRNFDWANCEALIVLTNPSDGEESYASVSTVNMDFIRSGYGAEIRQLPDEIRTLIALYAPLDGMNERGFAVSVNMIQDSDAINQDTGKPDITTTTAIRLLLNKAADVEEAIALLEQYDMHSSMGMMVHFALADRNGRSAAVEYVNDEMVVTDTPAVTNFYLAEGEKQGIGTSQSHTRYEILMDRLSENDGMTMDQVKDALDSVSKDNFTDAAASDGRSAEGFESTEWSIVFNLSSGEARYYHREDYENGYLLYVNQLSE